MKTRLKSLGGAAAALTVAGSLAVQTVGGFEGLRLYAYQDIVGVWTACYGETAGIRPGMKFSKETCNNMLVDSLIKHETRMRACMKNPDAIKDETYVAHLSLAYNVGTGAWCKSTAAKRLNAGDIKGSCEALTWFNKAGGKVVNGLVKRRAQEKALCLKGA